MTSGSVVPPRPYDPADPKPTTFPQVLRDEIDRVQSSREKRGVWNEGLRQQLTGLAFSGGGIRSATFNLGILQALAEKGLLRKFDYLSTVSGGGYIGSWLAAFIRRLTRERDFFYRESRKGAEPAQVRDGAAAPTVGVSLAAAVQQLSHAQQERDLRGHVGDGGHVDARRAAQRSTNSWR